MKRSIISETSVSTADICKLDHFESKSILGKARSDGQVVFDETVKEIPFEPLLHSGLQDL